MNVLKTPSFFRPSTPSSSPEPARPDSTYGFRPAKLSLGSFMRQPSLSNVDPPPAPVPQDASYLEILGLKLSEAVTKALIQPVAPPPANDLVAGKKPIPSGRGHALGRVIVAELNAVHDNTHLHRAVLRSLQKPLTVLLTNLSNLLLPLLGAQSFLAVPTISNHLLFPNPIQAHALAVNKFCEELLQFFDEMSLGLDVDSRGGDGLKPIRDGLVSLIKRVINPLIGAIRTELVSLVEALESSITTPPVKPVQGSSKTVTIYHPSIVALQTLMPSYCKVLSVCTTSAVSQAPLASLLICVLWKGLVALSHRSDTKSSSPDLSPMKKRQTMTPPLTPPLLFSMKLPPSRPASRPASPPCMVVSATPEQDSKALYDLLGALPRPSGGQAQEAVDEAFDGLRTLPDLLQFIKSQSEIMEPSSSLSTAKQLNKMTTDIPFLIALPIILFAFGEPSTSSVATVMGLSDDEYRRSCLSGFSRAEECAETIGRIVFDFFKKTNTISNHVVVHWLEAELDGMIDD